MKSSESWGSLASDIIWTYKVTSAASICMHHRAVTDQHIFAPISKSCMNGVMVVCACIYTLGVQRANGSDPNSDILSERPTDRIQFVSFIIQIDVPKSEQIRIIARPIPSDSRISEYWVVWDRGFQI